MISNVDLSNPSSGNAGVGGTEYQFVLLAELLIKLKPGEIEITFYSEKLQKLPHGVKQIVVENIADAYAKSCIEQIEHFVFRPRRDISTEIMGLGNGFTKLVPWLHITPKREYLDWFSSNLSVEQVIFVGDDQRMRIIDHEVYKKSTTVFNASNGNYSMTKNRRKNRVVYIGALVPRKGFHVLASVWADIRAEVSDAELVVIGSGALYDKSVRLGPLLLAEEEYENRFIELLGGKDELENNGVSFLGNLGIEKTDIIETATVGVVNPSGLTENCPMSVVEFYQSGIPVISSKKYGMRDMILSPRTGVLCKNRKQLSTAIIKFLKEETSAVEAGHEALIFGKEKFAPEVIVENWMQVFSCNFDTAPRKKGYVVHKLFAVLKKMRIIPADFPMVEDQKIFLANFRIKFLDSLR